MTQASTPKSLSSIYRGQARAKSSQRFSILRSVWIFSDEEEEAQLEDSGEARRLWHHGLSRLSPHPHPNCLANRPHQLSLPHHSPPMPQPRHLLLFKGPRMLSLMGMQERWRREGEGCDWHGPSLTLPWGSLFIPPKHVQLWAAVCPFAWLMNAPPDLAGSGREGRVRRKEKSCRREELPGPRPYAEAHFSSHGHVHRCMHECIQRCTLVHTCTYTPSSSLMAEAAVIGPSSILLCWWSPIPRSWMITLCPTLVTCLLGLESLRCDSHGHWAAVNI